MVGQGIEAAGTEEEAVIAAAADQRVGAEAAIDMELPARLRRAVEIEIVPGAEAGAVDGDDLLAGIGRVLSDCNVGVQVALLRPSRRSR